MGTSSDKLCPRKHEEPASSIPKDVQRKRGCQAAQLAADDEELVHCPCAAMHVDVSVHLAWQQLNSHCWTSAVAIKTVRSHLQYPRGR